jgi:hypothetical protein
MGEGSPGLKGGGGLSQKPDEATVITKIRIKNSFFIGQNSK